MEAKFTKGAWVLESDFITVEVDGIEEVICDFDPIDVYPTVYQRSEEEQEANQKLMVASPRLFEALNEIVIANELSSVRPAICCWDDLIQNAKDAIKIATE